MRYVVGIMPSIHVYRDAANNIKGVDLATPHGSHLLYYSTQALCEQELSEFKQMGTACHGLDA